MIIEGTLEDIVFRNEENGYTVAMFSHGDEFSTIVGTFLSISVGMMMRLSGSISTNKRYGEQFVVDSFEIVYPNSVMGIKKYLSSGLIKGIGEVTASAIVEKFKEQTFDIIEFSPSRLSEVKGISKQKAENIQNAFSELKKFQQTVIFLQKYNISTNMAMKIFAVYQDKTINTISNNPYCLVEDVDGIGFSTADKIAANMGIERSSEFRVRAAFLHILNENSDKNGNTYTIKQMLFENVATLLNLNKKDFEDVFNNVLDTLKLDKIIKNFFDDGQDIVMLTKYYFMENQVAQKLALLNLCAKIEDRDVSGEIEAFEKTNKIAFDQNQKNAISSSIKNGVSIITGGPGTGKTTIIKCILQILKQSKQKVMLMAPTGRASKRLSESTNETAKTIHRALEVDFMGDRRVFVHNENKQLDATCVIVDEFSMVDIALCGSLLKALPRDCKLILVGDKDQLPSVGAGNVLADILQSEVINVCYLQKIFRQDEKSKIVENAHLINNAEMPILDNSSSDFFFEQKENLVDIKNTISALVTTRIASFKKIEPSKIQVLAPLKAGVCGTINLNETLQQQINPAQGGKFEIMVGTVCFREGDKVMQTCNNYDLVWTKQDQYFVENGAGVFNGDIGYILNINRSNGEVKVLFEDGRLCVYPRSELSQLSLAYAITIHKSQGSEFDVVVIPIIAGTRMILTKNLIYTAVTRAKKMVVLVGERKNLSVMVRNTYTVQRWTRLKKFLIVANQNARELYVQ